MTNQQPVRLVIIDDNNRTASNMSHFIQRAIPSTQIEFILLNPNQATALQEFFSMVEASNASAVLVDQRLGEQSSASYTGLELANLLRVANPTMPIFILTKYTQEDKLEEKGFDVDDVIDKAILRKRPESYVGRLMRAIGRYEDVRSVESKRIKELIALSLSRELNKDEIIELNRLRAEAGMAVLGNEIELTEKTRMKLESKKQVFEALKKLLEDE